MAEAQSSTDPHAEDLERGNSLSEGESRRQFIKKLPYIAPAMETFLLSTGTDVHGDDDDDDDDDKKKKKKKKKKKTSPSGPGPPPPPPDDDDDDDD